MGHPGLWLIGAGLEVVEVKAGEVDAGSGWTISLLGVG